MPATRTSLSIVQILYFLLDMVILSINKDIYPVYEKEFHFATTKIGDLISKEIKLKTNGVGKAKFNIF